MADNAVVLDIDTKFLQNLQAADAALAKAAKQAQNLTKAFQKTLSGSGNFSQQVQQIYAGLAKIGGADFSKGVAQIDTSLRTSNDAVTLLATNLTKLKQEFNAMLSASTGSKAKGTHMRITSDADMENIAKLKHAIEQIDNTLNNRKRKKALSLVDIQGLNEQKALYKRTVDELSMTDAQRTNAVVKETNKRIKEAEREAKAVQNALNNRYTSSPKAALSYATQAKNINEMTRALQYLDQVRASINPNTKRGAKDIEKINSAMSQLRTKMYEVKEGSDRVKNSTKDIKDNIDKATKSSSQLKNAMVSLFSISAIRGYINQLIKVRSEMELQHRSLIAIVKNKAQANEVWQQTIDLAVKSPFSIQDMLKSTKQLAAYRIETEKLVETNKMLSDISAGVGVEMSRLILAFGQVKAANYLRGTELRQFSEAGVNILDELAKHFSVLEGTTVSVGEVFDRVSKRMVTFADVEQVLKNVTSAGGAFYRMQEIQAETLRGQISNLKDVISLMLNDIGKANDGMMKGTVQAARALLQNWETLVTVIKAVVALLAAHKLSSMMAAFSTATSQSVGAWKALGLQIKKAGTGIVNYFKGINFASLGAVAAIALVVQAFSDMAAKKAAIAAVGREVDELNKSASELSKSFVKALAELDLEAIKKSIVQMATLIKNEFNVDNLIDFDKLSGMDMSQLKALYHELNTIYDKYSASYYTLATRYEEIVASQTFLNKFIGKDFWAGTMASADASVDLFASGLKRDLEKYSDLANDVFSKVQGEYASMVKAINDANKEFSPGSDEDNAFKALYGGKRENETRLQYLNRMRDAYVELQSTLKDLGVNVQPTINKLNELFDYSGTSQTGETVRELTQLLSPLQSMLLGLTKDEKEVEIKANIDKLSGKEEWDDFMTELAYDAANRYFSIEIKPYIYQPDKKEIKDWQKNYNEKFKGYEGFQKFTVGNMDTTQAKEVKRLQEAYNALYDTIQRVKNGSKDAYPTEKLAELEKGLKQIREQGLWYGVDFADKNKTGGKSIEDLYSERLKVIMDMHKEYKALQKTFSDTESSATVITKFADAFETAFKGIEDFSIVDVLFESEGGVEQALQRLLNTLPATAKEARFAIERQLAEIRGEVRLEAKLASDETLKQEVEDMFSGYELWLDVQKLDIPPDFAKDLFNIDTTSLDELKNKLKLLKPAFDGQDMLDEYNAYLRKVDEMEAKAQQERLKKYLEYSRNSIGERAKIKMEELRQLAEIEETFKVRQGDSAEAIAMKNSARDAAINGVREQTQQAINKFEWDEFQSSETFVSLFKDLDMASDSLVQHALTKLREFKDEWKDMPIEDMRGIVEKINQLEMQLAEASPFSHARETKKYLKENNVGSVEELQADNIKQEEKLGMMNEELAIWEQATAFMREGNQEAAIALDYGDGRLGIENMTLEQMEAQSDSLKEQIKDSKNQIAVNTENIGKHKQLAASLRAQADALKKCDKMAQDLYDAFRDMAEVLGADESSPAVIMADTGMQMASNVMQTIALSKELKAASENASAFGKAMNTAMGIIGWIVMAVQLLTMALKAVFEIHDNALQEQIDTIAKRVDILNYKLERLEEQLEKAYNTDQLEQYGESFKETTEQMIDDYNAMIALEQDKKKSDEAQIEQWEKERLEAMKRLNEYEEELFTTATDGILDNTLSVARDFVDAWYDSFQETGDGLAGLQDNFNEMFQNLVKQQVAMAVVGDFVEDIKAAVQKAIKPGDYTLDEREAQELREYAQKLPALSTALEAAFESLGGLDEISSIGGLSELGKGIQGVTETTAQVIEAYLNSVRFYVADSNLHIKSLRDMFESSDITRNPILNELREHTRIIELIDKRLASVINADSGGSYLRVQ